MCERHHARDLHRRVCVQGSVGPDESDRLRWDAGFDELAAGLFENFSAVREYEDSFAARHVLSDDLGRFDGLAGAHEFDEENASVILPGSPDVADGSLLVAAQSIFGD